MEKVNGIKVGDMVMVVRGHECVVATVGGIPYTVRAILNQVGGGWRCGICGTRDIAPNETLGAQFYTAMHGIPLSWLLKIDPPADDETTEQPEEISA